MKISKTIAILFMLLFISRCAFGQDKKISQLTALPSISGNEYIPCEISGNNYYLTPNQIYYWFTTTGACVPLSGTSNIAPLTGTIEFRGSNNKILIGDSVGSYNLFAGNTLNAATATNISNININNLGSIAIKAINDTLQAGCNYSNGEILTYCSDGDNTTTTKLYPDSFIISGFNNFRGAEYDIDYSANFTHRSLINKGWAASNFLPITNSITINGITKALNPSPSFTTSSLSGTGFVYQSGSTTSYTTSIPNASLANSTISGISLGSNLFSHSNGYGIGGTPFNGSSAQSWTTDTTVIGSKPYITAKLAGKLANTGSITINGSTQTFSSNPSFTVSGGITSPTTYTPYGIPVMTNSTTVKSFKIFSLSDTLNGRPQIGNTNIPFASTGITNPYDLNIYNDAALNSTLEGGNTVISMAGYNTHTTGGGYGPSIQFSKNNGTSASPTQPVAGTELGSLYFGTQQTNGTVGSFVSGAVARVFATEAWTTGINGGTQILFEVCKNNAGAGGLFQTAMLIDNTSFVGFGLNSSAPSYPVHCVTTSSVAAYAGKFQMNAIGSPASSGTGGLYGLNQSTNTGVNISQGGANLGLEGIANGTTAGHNSGVFGYAYNSSAINTGVTGSGAGIGAYNSIGVLGVTNSSGTFNIGVMAYIGSSDPTSTQAKSSALCVDNGGNSVPVAIFGVNGTTKLSISSSGILQYNTNTTGSGTALLGTNCPATTVSAPYTWLQMQSSDGNTVYVPAWK